MYDFDRKVLPYHPVASGYVNTHRHPDTTAVILNWSRFPNVRSISSSLCGPWLDTVISEVLIWNNSPRKLSYEDFEGTECERSQLRIYNSPTNVYFQARFMACAEATTPYCFIQDDDYLVSSSVMHSLASRIASFNHPHTIHLSPSHEHLSTSLREIHVPGREGSYYHPSIHTSFAWLGYGTILARSEALDFLDLMHHLNASDEEMKMADNYYTILSNRVPEVWFYQDIELGGGEPFTVGSEGHERNNKHILRAAEYLTSIVESIASQSISKLPYVFLGNRDMSDPIFRAACRQISCVLETNIPLLPNGTTHSAQDAREILSVEKRNLEILGPNAQKSYIDHPLSMAVDGDFGTYFHSIRGARVGDTITLDFFAEVRAPERRHLEMAWLVDTHTVQILRQSEFSSSLDGVNWHTEASKPTCRLVNVYTTIAQFTDEDVFECSVRFYNVTEVSTRQTGCRLFRTTFTGSGRAGNTLRWKIYELWIRHEIADPLKD
ncbi:unnamed protein product [Somion occarium]